MGFSGLKHETCGSLGTCYMKLPVIPGHEFSGRVTELGEGAKDHHKVDVGDLVVSEQIITCDKCRFCNKGQYQVNHNLKKKKKKSSRPVFWLHCCATKFRPSMLLSVNHKTVDKLKFISLSWKNCQGTGASQGQNFRHVWHPQILRSYILIGTRELSSIE